VDKEQLLRHLQCSGYLKSESVAAAMRSVPREVFVPDYLKPHAYEDRPLSIGSGQTISAPHMVAIMLEALDLHPRQRVLEVGTGTGYHAAVVATVVSPGPVYTVERIPELAEKARRNLQQLGLDNVTVVVSDGSVGLPEHAPYHRIYATCSTPTVPQPLIDQMAPRGKMLIPVGSTYSNLVLIEKNESIRRTNLGGCAFVPMIGTGGHRE